MEAPLFASSTESAWVLRAVESDSMRPRAEEPADVVKMDTRGLGGARDTLERQDVAHGVGGRKFLINQSSKA